MANITPTITRVVGQGGLDGYQVIWATMHNGDVGLPVGSAIGDGASAVVPSGGGFFAGFADKSAAITGTFGAGGNMVIEGSNDGGTTYFALTTPIGGGLGTITAAALNAVTEAVLWLRPRVSAGDGTTALTATMFFRKTQTP